MDGSEYLRLQEIYNQKILCNGDGVPWWTLTKKEQEYYQWLFAQEKE
jgi:hypothetical protein